MATHTQHVPVAQRAAVYAHHAIPPQQYQQQHVPMAQHAALPSQYYQQQQPHPSYPPPHPQYPQQPQHPPPHPQQQPLPPQQQQQQQQSSVPVDPTTLTLVSNNTGTTAQPVKVSNINVSDESFHLTMISLLGCILTQLVSYEDLQYPQGRGQITMFHTAYVPGISISSYLKRIVLYTKISTEVLIQSVLHIHQLMQRSYQPLIVNKLNVHRLLLTSILTTAKSFDDAHYNNKYYSYIGGVPLSELNALEVEYLSILNFDFYVSTQTYQYFYQMIIDANIHQAGCCECAPCLVNLPKSLPIDDYVPEVDIDFSYLDALVLQTQQQRKTSWYLEEETECGRGVVERNENGQMMMISPVRNGSESSTQQYSSSSSGHHHSISSTSQVKTPRASVSQRQRSSQQQQKTPKQSHITGASSSSTAVLPASQLTTFVHYRSTSPVSFMSSNNTNTHTGLIGVYDHSPTSRSYSTSSYPASSRLTHHSSISLNQAGAGNNGVAVHGNNGMHSPSISLSHADSYVNERFRSVTVHEEEVEVDLIENQSFVNEYDEVLEMNAKNARQNSNDDDAADESVTPKQYDSFQGTPNAVMMTTTSVTPIATKQVVVVGNSQHDQYASDDENDRMTVSSTPPPPSSQQVQSNADRQHQSQIRQKARLYGEQDEVQQLVM